MIKPIRNFAALVALAMALALPATLLAAEGKVESVRVHGPSLDGNLQGNDATRDVHVYLPPGYATGSKRYPVVYFLHGYAVTADVYVKDVLKLPDSVNTAVAAGGHEFIIVMPDAFTRFGGSFYSSSPVIGDWEKFIAKDLVTWVDSHYRTIATREGRGLAGHSMGGYGTLRIGMKYPKVFGALYAMSSAINHSVPSAAVVKTELARMTPDMKSEVRKSTDGVQSRASAWTPNKKKPPFYFDLPFDADGIPVKGVAKKWSANSLEPWLDHKARVMRSFSGVALDVGNQDGLKADNTKFDAALTQHGVPHNFEVYEGTHGNKVGARFTDKVLPFFAKHLAAPQ